MESHGTDGTARSASDPWDGVSTELHALGDRLKSTYRESAGEEGPDEEQVSEAVSTLLDAWNRLAASLSVALADPQTREQLRRAAGSFAAAVGATLSQLGEELAQVPPRPEEGPPARRDDDGTGSTPSP